MWYVITLHTLGHGGVLDNLPIGTIRYASDWILETIAYYAVDCFAIISGYVGYREVKIMTEYPEAILVESDTEFCDQNNRPKGSYHRYGKGLMDGRRVARHSLFTREYFGAPLANLVRMSAFKEYGGFDVAFSYIIAYDFL